MRWSWMLLAFSSLSFLGFGVSPPTPGRGADDFGRSRLHVLRALERSGSGRCAQLAHHRSQSLGRRVRQGAWYRPGAEGAGPTWPSRPSSRFAASASDSAAAPAPLLPVALDGVTPPPSETRTSCAFADRCRTERPRLESAPTGERVRCHFIEDAARLPMDGRAPSEPASGGETADVNANRPVLELSGLSISYAKPAARGCPFQRRCPRRVGAPCDTDVPPWQETGEGHSIRCHIPLPELRRGQLDDEAAKARALLQS